MSSASPRIKKVRQQKSAGKVMLIAFFNRKGVVYQHIVSQAQTANANYYQGAIAKLCEPIA